MTTIRSSGGRVVRYEILGPPRVVEAGRARQIRGWKAAILLTVLVVRADQLVTTSQLAAEIWGGHPPRRASDLLQVYISQLRKALRGPGRPASPIVTRPPGYLLRLGADELDLGLLRQLLGDGRAAAARGQPAQASACCLRALALCRGPVPAELGTGPIIGGFRTWLAEARIECLELLAAAQLELGRHREIVSLLYSLVTQYPARESFCRQLMLALYRSDCREEALAVYQSAARMLDDELGLRPGPVLQDLRQAIVAADARLDWRVPV